MAAAPEILVVDGYLVKVWPGSEPDVWVAHCPTVRCVAQQATRDSAVAAIREEIAEMLSELSTAPPLDVPARDATASV